MTTKLIAGLSEEIKATCQSLRKLLATHGASTWEIEIQKIEDRDYSISSSANDSLGMFGGMGSISDWVISERNGHRLAGRSKKEVNGELEQLTNKLFALLKSMAKL